ncbi:MAG: hypothetical protein AABX66_03060 [Nanoarchaeota archaeon]
MVQEVPLGEITLRKYEKPYESTQRDIIRKVCLSLGLLQPGDSRDIIVDIFLVLDESRKKKSWLSSFEIRDKVETLRKSNSLEIKGLAESNIRRQLKRLRDLMLIDKHDNKYRILEFDSLSVLFEKNIEKFLLPQIIERIKEYLGKLDNAN